MVVKIFTGTTFSYLLEETNIIKASGKKIE